MNESAHPRGGGENTFYLHTIHSHAGSSPRGRGKLCCTRQVCLSVRLIPAGAGKTNGLPLYTYIIGAHPRGGGENRRRTRSIASAYGSSPRGRGKLLVCARVPGLTRLIPAGAGKTRSSRCSASSWRAHPRGGGENREGVTVQETGVGSSPRGRGKRRSRHQCRRGCRLIPAGAGKTI